MDPRHLLLLLVCVLCFSDGWSLGQGRRWRRFRCRRPQLENGIIRLKSRGRVARYRCRQGYELYGLRFNTCVARRWLDPQPICIRAGCRDLEAIDNGFLDFVRPNKLAHYSCEPGFLLRGHGVMYCDGRRWNGTEPECQGTGASSAGSGVFSCDFEADDLCGWSHDRTAHFQWSRHAGTTPSVDMYTGPSHDHTLGESPSGHYMFIEASDPRVENDTARLFSPIYSKEQSVDACFSMWYHHWGGSVGSIRVYILPVSESLDDQEGPAWEITDSQGDRWVNALVQAPVMLHDFQVVIEGMRGDSYMSDSAIDDVALKHGDECTTVTAPPASTTPFFSAVSCRGRCDNHVNPLSTACGCTHECLLVNNCCSDYTTACLEEDTSADGPTSSSGEMETTSTPIPSAESTTLRTTTDRTTTTIPRKTTPDWGTTTSDRPARTTPRWTTTAAETTSTFASSTTAVWTSARTTTFPTTTTRRARTTTSPTTITPRTARTITFPTTTTPRPTTTTMRYTTEYTTPPRTLPPRTTTTPRTTQTIPKTRQTTQYTTTTGTTQPSVRTTQWSSPSATVATSQPPETTRSTNRPTYRPTTSLPTTSPTPATTTDMSNELPALTFEGNENYLPTASRSKSSTSASSGFPLYAAVGLAVGGVLVVATVAAVLARRYRRGGRRGHTGPLGGDDDDSLMFFSEPDSAEPTLDLRLRSRAEPVPSRPAPRKPTKERKDSAELEEFGVEAFEDQSETARLTK